MKSLYSYFIKEVKEFFNVNENLSKYIIWDNIFTTTNKISEGTFPMKTIITEEMRFRQRVVEYARDAGYTWIYDSMCIQIKKNEVDEKVEEISQK